MGHAATETRRLIETFQELGGRAIFLCQSCAYLVQHPDGVVGQAFLMTDEVADVMSLVMGCLVDLFGGGVEASAPRSALLVERAGARVAFQATLPGPSAPDRAGARLLRLLCDEWNVTRGHDVCHVYGVFSAGTLGERIRELGLASCPASQPP